MKPPKRKPKYLTSLVNLGNAELRNHHSVMLEAGVVPRAKVLDQHMIDSYLMRGLLNLGQHRAGERLLQQAAHAGIWPTGVNLAATGSGGGVSNHVPFGAFPFGKTLAKIEKYCGARSAFIVKRVVVFDWDISSSAMKMKALRAGLDVIGGGRRRNPISNLQAAAQRKKSADVIALKTV